MDALRAAQRDDRPACEAPAKQFLAVRLLRWKQADPTVEVFERGLELKEGTAKYVEVLALDLAAHTKYESRVPATKSLPEKLAGLSAASLLLQDFEHRLTDGVVSPDDMPRNRVYPVGGAQCFLLDSLGVDWKAAAERAGSEFAYAKFLRGALASTEADLESLLAQAKERYDYAKNAAATKKQLDAYRAAFEDALAAFEVQPGQRVEVTISVNGLKRSRVSTARKWFVEGGGRCYCADYKVYVLTREGVRIEAESSGILELNDWEKRVRTAIVLAQGEMQIEMDSAPLTPEEGRLYRFQKVDLRAENIKVESLEPGTLRRSGSRLLIDLRPPGATGRGAGPG